MAAEGFSGMADLIAGLSAFGEAVQAEASAIVRLSAEHMALEVQRDYAVVEADLVSGVVVEDGKGGQSGGSHPLRYKVRSKAPHAHLYEYGTVQRFTAETGANRGTMPAKPTFVPAAVRARARMHGALVSMVKRQRVAGMTGTMEVRES